MNQRILIFQRQWTSFKELKWWNRRVKKPNEEICRMMNCSWTYEIMKNWAFCWNWYKTRAFWFLIYQFSHEARTVFNDHFHSEKWIIWIFSKSLRWNNWWWSPIRTSRIADVDLLKFLSCQNYWGINLSFLLSRQDSSRLIIIIIIRKGPSQRVSL